MSVLLGAPHLLGVLLGLATSLGGLLGFVRQEGGELTRMVWKSFSNPDVDEYKDFSSLNGDTNHCKWV